MVPLLSEGIARATYRHHGACYRRKVACLLSAHAVPAFVNDAHTRSLPTAAITAITAVATNDDVDNVQHQRQPGPDAGLMDIDSDSDGPAASESADDYDDSNDSDYDGGERYEVRAILSHQCDSRGNVEYEVLWNVQYVNETTWEPKCHLDGCDALLAQYMVHCPH